MSDDELFVAMRNLKRDIHPANIEQLIEVEKGIAAPLRSRISELEREVTNLELSCTEWEHKAREYAKDVRETWRLAQAKGQTEAYRLLEDMVRRVGYDEALKESV